MRLTNQVYQAGARPWKTYPPFWSDCDTVGMPNLALIGATLYVISEPAGDFRNVSPQWAPAQGMTCVVESGDPTRAEVREQLAAPLNRIRGHSRGSAELAPEEDLVRRHVIRYRRSRQPRRVGRQMARASPTMCSIQYTTQPLTTTNSHIGKVTRAIWRCLP